MLFKFEWFQFAILWGYLIIDYLYKYEFSKLKQEIHDKLIYYKEIN